MQHAREFMFPAKLALAIFHHRRLPLLLHPFRVTTGRESGPLSCQQEAAHIGILFEITNEAIDRLLHLHCQRILGLGAIEGNFRDPLTHLAENLWCPRISFESHVVSTPGCSSRKLYSKDRAASAEEMGAGGHPPFGTH